MSSSQFYSINIYDNNNNLSYRHIAPYRVSIAKSVNNYGYCSIAIPHGKTNINEMHKYPIDNIVQVWRYPRDPLSGTTKWGGREEFVGIIRKRWEDQDKEGYEYTGLGIYGLNYLLSSRDVDYQATTEGTGYTLKTDYADDMMKEIVYENMEAGVVDTDREFPSDFSIAQDIHAAPEITFEFPHQNVLSTLQKIADISAQEGTRLYFDIIRKNASSFQFQTFINQRGGDTTIGQGMRGGVLFGDWLGNIVHPVLLEDYTDEYNVVNAWGAGDPGKQKKAQEIATEWVNRSKWGRREFTIQAPVNTDDDALPSLAKAALHGGHPYLTFTCTLLDTYANAVYGVHWWFGDKVKVGFNTKNYIGLVNSIQIDYTAKRGNQPAVEDLKADFHYEEPIVQAGL